MPPLFAAHLAEFLSDERVIELPKWKWWPILHGIILTVRPAKSAQRYKGCLDKGRLALDCPHTKYC